MNEIELPSGDPGAVPAQETVEAGEIDAALIEKSLDDLWHDTLTTARRCPYGCAGRCRCWF